MARKVKNAALDRAQEKARKQKRLAIILCSVLALVLVYEVPKTMKLMSSGGEGARGRGFGVDAGRAEPGRPDVGFAFEPVRVVPSLRGAVGRPGAVARRLRAGSARPGPADRVRAIREQGPVPPVRPEVGRCAAGQARPKKSSTSQPKTKTGGPPKTPPAPLPTTAVISINGELSSVTVGTDFPLAGVVFQQAGNSPLFHLVSLTQTSAKVAIAGGSYANGAPALSLTVGTPVTLQNTADGTRYTLLLEPQGTQVPTSTTPTGTTPTGTTPTVTTPPPSVVPSSGG